MITNDSNHAEESQSSRVLSLIANDTRRAVLRSLDQAEEGVLDVEELADRVAHRVEPTGPVDHAHRERVKTMLLHNHLPRLVEGGLVSYDSGSGSVRRLEDDFTRELLDVVDERSAFE